MSPLPNNKKLTDAAVIEPPAPSPKKGLLVLGVVLLVWVGLAALFFANRYKVIDWWRLRGYQPPTAVQQLADQTTMESYARHLFYLNRPELLSSVSGFRQHCPENKENIVLGCYHPGQNGIFIYQVKDPELQGVTQVTAAHEVLHAVYARLSTGDRTHLDQMLRDYYEHGLTDGRVKDEIKIYQKTEPTDVLNEMNSIFGTEVADLPPQLEAYYKHYFSNRSAVVAYEKRYEGAFTARQGKIQQDDQQLAVMKRQIDSQQAGLQAEQDQLDAAHSQLSALLASGQTGQYNANVTSYNNRVSVYNDDVASLKELIDQYNQLVAARNAVAGELTTLDKAIDTRLTPQTAH